MKPFEKKLIYHAQSNCAGYKPLAGSFAIAKRCECEHGIKIDVEEYGEDWISCREEFFGFVGPNIIFLFSTGKGNERKVANFIAETEKRLKVKTPSDIQGFKNLDGVVCVWPSKWWTSQDVRMQLFTILLRCGTAYNRNFEKALNSQDYIRDTRKAVDRFFEGYTCSDEDFSDGYSGWVSIFSDIESDSKYDFEDDFDYKWKYIRTDTKGKNYKTELEKAWKIESEKAFNSYLRKPVQIKKKKSYVKKSRRI